MVQLRLDNREARKVNKQYFNSIMVQLRHVCFFIVNDIHLFQFHNGTIKTLNNVSIPSTGTLFQFHNGTIKTSWR